MGALISFLWVAGPAWYIRLTGTEVPGRVFTDGCYDCDVNAWVIYQDAQGQFHEIPPEGAITSGVYQNGEQLSVWYLPSDPTSTFIGGGNTIVLYATTGTKLLFGVLFFGIPSLIIFVRTVRQLIRACVQAEHFAHLWWLLLGCLLILSPALVALHFWPPSGADPGIGPARNFQVGQTVAVDGRWEVTVHAGGTGAAEAAGTFCLEVDITLRNTTNQPLAFSVGQFTLYNTQEQALASCSIDAPRLANATLAPGEVMQGALAYQLPASLRRCYLGFRPDLANGLSLGQSFWRLSVSAAGSGASLAGL